MPVGACPPSAVADAELRTLSSAATSIAVGSPSTITVPSITLHFPSLEMLLLLYALTSTLGHKGASFRAEQQQPKGKQKTFSALRPIVLE